MKKTFYLPKHLVSELVEFADNNEIPQSQVVSIGVMLYLKLANYGDPATEAIHKIATNQVTIDDIIRR